MKISSLIAQLQLIRQRYGDIDITNLDDKPLSKVEILDPDGYIEARIALRDDSPSTRA
jgi:hypothetical protein